jgi:hypothetical protein
VIIRDARQLEFVYKVLISIMKTDNVISSRAAFCQCISRISGNFCQCYFYCNTCVYKQTLTCLDFAVILGLAAHNDRQTQYMAEYLCELSLLHTELSVYPFGLMASACQLMARLALHKGQLIISSY